MQKKYFLLRLLPNRAAFMADMSEEERTIMRQHIAYWTPQVETRTMIVMGPVADPNGGWGLGVVQVESEDELHELIRNDPANAIGSYEITPMPNVRYRE
jgi:uncharacterized protein YciI